MSVSAIRMLQLNLGQWSDATFGSPPERGPLPPLHHLAKEVQEAIAAPDSIEEYADCLLLLLDAARRAGMGADELVHAALDKLAVCRARNYSVKGDDGVIEHVRS